MVFCFLIKHAIFWSFRCELPLTRLFLLKWWSVDCRDTCSSMKKWSCLLWAWVRFGFLWCLVVFWGCMRICLLTIVVKLMSTFKKLEWQKNFPWNARLSDFLSHVLSIGGRWSSPTVMLASLKLNVLDSVSLEMSDCLFHAISLRSAITTVVTISEILKTKGFATEESKYQTSISQLFVQLRRRKWWWPQLLIVHWTEILTSTVDMRDENNGRLVQKAKVKSLSIGFHFIFLEPFPCDRLCCIWPLLLHLNGILTWFHFTHWILIRLLICSDWDPVEEGRQLPRFDQNFIRWIDHHCRQSSAGGGCGAQICQLRKRKQGLAQTRERN